MPLGIAALACAWRLVRNTRSDEARPLDWTGFFLSGAALTCLLTGTEAAGQQDAHFMQAGLLLLASVALGVAAWTYALRAAHPLLDVTTLQVPTF